MIHCYQHNDELKLQRNSLSSPSSGLELVLYVAVWTKEVGLLENVNARFCSRQFLMRTFPTARLSPSGEYFLKQHRAPELHFQLQMYHVATSPEPEKVAK